jgi:4-hydroxy-tetrahydrodipicolinate synthase
MMFYGSIVALATPWKSGKLDIESLKKLVGFHNRSGTNAIVVCGSTGEGSLLSMEERKQIIEIVKDVSNTPVIVGCGGVSTEHVLEQVKQANTLKADGLLVVTPFYSKPTQKGIIEHFKHINKNTKLPIIAYNNQGRTVVEMTVETLGEIFKLENVVGLKDSTSDTSRVVQIKNLVHKKISILGGDDPFVLSHLAQGADGFISITANVAPQLMTDLFNFWQNGNIKIAQRLNSDLMNLHLALVAEPNPIPVKCALNMLGGCLNELKLPLVPAQKTTMQKIKNALDQLSL